MAEKLYNVRCMVCLADCQASEVRHFLVHLATGLQVEEYWTVAVDICELCLLGENEPIPFIVTEKGKTESIKRGSGRKENA